MQRINDDARKACWIELAFFQVKLPRSILLSHQPPLKTIGEACDNALQMGQLLVKVASQLIQFLSFAKLFGGYGFVELGGERTIVSAPRFVGTEVAGALGRARRLGGAHGGGVGPVRRP